MKNYTATNKSGKQFSFTTCDGNQAKRIAEKFFNNTDIVIRDNETNEEFPLIDEWLSNRAYISRCMTSGRYLLYIKDTLGGKESFAPIIQVTKEIVPKTMVNEFNEYKAIETTHKIGNWFVGFVVDGSTFQFKDYCEIHGDIVFEAIK